MSLKRISMLALVLMVLCALVAFAGEQPINGSNFAYSGIVSKEYNAANLTQDVVIVDNNGNELVYGTDYDVSYSNNYNVGTAGITITFMNDYCGTIEDSFTITPAPLSIMGTCVSGKAYDGTTDADVEIGFVSGAKGEDAPEVTAVASFSDKNVGEDKDVNIEYFVESSNYEAPQSEQSCASITPCELTIAASDITVTSKAYDGTATATAALTTTPQIVVGDDVDFSIDDASFDSAAVGTNKTVSFTLNVSGADKDNYTFSYDNAYGDITARDASNATVGQIADVSYNGTAQTPSLNIVCDGLELTEGTDYTVDFTDNIAVGTANVQVEFQDNFSGSLMRQFTINKAQLTISGTKVNDKQYDGSTKCSIRFKGKLAGVASGDDVSVTAQAAFKSSNPGNNKSVVVEYSISGKDADSYIAPKPVTLRASITEKTPEQSDESNKNSADAVAESLTIETLQDNASFTVQIVDDTASITVFDEDGNEIMANKLTFFRMGELFGDEVEYVQFAVADELVLKLKKDFYLFCVTGRTVTFVLENNTITVLFNDSIVYNVDLSPIVGTVNKLVFDAHTLKGYDEEDNELADFGLNL